MIGATSGRIWDEAATADALRLAHDFETRWRNSKPGWRPDPADFIPGGSGSCGNGTFLALLRVDLALRRGCGEESSLESYRDRYPDLGGDVLVALIYEDYCLREEASDQPGPDEYYERFPGLDQPLREIFEIHDLVKPRTMGSTRIHGPLPLDERFNELSQTIGGFFLVEELGRGSFARVFLARERQLADRLVALKVSRTGSREPQALARLQHTNIVPVHSYRIDPATDLHLLCMPYFGRVTLAQVLDDPALCAAKGGDALVARLDQLLDDQGSNHGRQSARDALSSRSFARAVAWWGAQMADALRHAHDRGVLHRDLKPSNILIAADGTPMLLDFNLARELDLAAKDSGRLGGTLAYMAPEHLAALIEGHDDEGIDQRADLYALGLILAEMLGTRPPSGCSSIVNPRQVLDLRRAGVPTLARRTPPIPAALVAVIARCLAVMPADRYDSAGDLAFDLGAVADNSPLQFAREPWLDRSSRWIRRNVAALVVFFSGMMLVAGTLIAWFQIRSAAYRLAVETRELRQEGIRSFEVGNFGAAAFQFALAANRCQNHAELDAVRRDSLERQQAAAASGEIRKRAETFFQTADPLRFAILGFGGDQASASRDLVAAFQPLGVLTEANWTAHPMIERLDERQRTRLIREVDDLLFFWVVAAARAPTDPAAPAAERSDRERNAVAYCDKALAFSAHPGPWVALRRWWQDRSTINPPGPRLPALLHEEKAAVCFRWFLLGMLGSDAETSLHWLDRAVRLEPENYWHHFALAYEQQQHGNWIVARANYDAAVALRPDFPWAWKNRGLLAEQLGDWQIALDDLKRALTACRSPGDAAGVDLELGRAHQSLGAFGAARANYAAVLLIDPSREVACAARRDRARLEASSGAIGRALVIFDELIRANPNDWLARQGRANLLLRRGRLGDAGADLDMIIEHARGQSLVATALMARAAAQLAVGQLGAAWADGSAGFAIHPTPAAARFLDRMKLRLGQDLDAWPLFPEEFDQWPSGGASLRADLRAAATRLGGRVAEGLIAVELGLRRAVLLSAALDHDAALGEVDQVIQAVPGSVAARETRARILRRSGQTDQAMLDVIEGLKSEPESAHLIELRGLIRVEQGEVAAGLADLNVASDRGSPTARGAAMAGALERLGRYETAAQVWTERIEADPADVKAQLGLARAYRHLGQWDRALASLEAAASLVEPRSPLAVEVALAYAACLPARPDRLPRVITLCGW